MTAVLNYKILLLFFVILCFALFAVCRKQLEGFDDAAENNTFAYESSVLKDVNKKTVKYVADMLMKQQRERVSWLRLLWNENKRTKEAIFPAEIALAQAVKTLVFTTSSLISVDPAVIVKATVFQVIAAAMVADATKSLEAAKAAHNKASNDLNNARRLIGIAAKQEYLDKEIQMYAGADASVKKADCESIIPTARSDE